MEQKRQLAAIMFTDIVGYTAMMEQDEETASAAVDRYRSVLEAIVAEHNGKIKHYYGDGALVLFSTATDATRCGLALQLEYQQEPVVPLRVGLHIGEIMIKGDEIYGPGINLASRIESLGRSGTVLFSKNIHEKIRNKKEFSSISLGPFYFKNVEEPVEVFALTNKGLPVPSVDEVAAKLKEPKASKGLNKSSAVILGAVVVAALIAIYFLGKSNVGGTPKLEHTSIAVLPFTNMSSDAENEFFCDGVTEDILTHLSKLKNLKVISRTSVMHFKGSELTLPEIARELDVEYIVEGSVRKQGDQVAITAQLIHAGSDGHIWAENFQRELNDVFAIQSEVAQRITRALNLRISVEEQKGLRTSPTENVEAYENFLSGRKIADDRSEQGLTKAKTYFEKAIELDPLYVEAYGELANIWLLFDLYYGYSSDSCHQEALGILNDAMSIDPLNYRVHTSWGRYYDNDPAKYSISEDHYNKAIELNPNDATAYHQYGVLLAWDRRPDEALKSIEMALELDPYSNVINRNMVYKLKGVGRYEEALEFAKNNARIIGDDHIYSNMLCDLYADLGEWDAALKIAERIDSVYPELAGFNSQSENVKFALEHDQEKILSRLSYAIRNNERNIGAVHWYVQRCMQFGAHEQAESFMLSDIYLDRMDSLGRLWDNAVVHYFKKEYADSEAILKEIEPNLHNRYYGLIKLGREVEARAFMEDPTNELDHYHEAMLYAGLGELETALDHFEQIENWGEVANSRFDPEFEPLWNDPRFQAKVAEYNFPPLKNQ